MGFYGIFKIRNILKIQTAAFTSKQSVPQLFFYFFFLIFLKVFITKCRRLIEEKKLKTNFWEIVQN